MKGHARWSARPPILRKPRWQWRQLQRQTEWSCASEFSPPSSTASCGIKHAKQDAGLQLRAMWWPSRKGRLQAENFRWKTCCNTKSIAKGYSRARGGRLTLRVFASADEAIALEFREIPCQISGESLIASQVHAGSWLPGHDVPPQQIDEYP